MPGSAGTSGTVVFSTRDGTPFTDAQKAAISEAVARATGVAGVAQIVDPFVTQAQKEAQAKKVADGRAQIVAAKAQLVDGQTQLDAAKAQLADGQKQLDAAKAQLATQQQQLDAAKSAPGVTAATLAQLAIQQQALDAGKAQLTTQQQQLDASAATIAAQQKQIDSSLATIAAQSKQLEEGATLSQLASKIRLVSDDGSTALAAVMFSGTSLSVPQKLKTAVKRRSSRPRSTGSTSTLVIDRAGDPEPLRRRRAGRPRDRRDRPAPHRADPDRRRPPDSHGAARRRDRRARRPLPRGRRGHGVGNADPRCDARARGGIDYALFIINRHRRQLRDGYTVAESIALANGTSGNAVLFAGSTVVIALLALNLTGIPFLGLMGTVGAVSVAIAVVIAVTLTPALLSLVGMRVLRGSRRRTSSTRWAPRPWPRHTRFPARGRSLSRSWASRSSW